MCLPYGGTTSMIWLLHMGNSILNFAIVENINNWLYMICLNRGRKEGHYIFYYFCMQFLFDVFLKNMILH